jgi:putative membrane protein
VQSSHRGPLVLLGALVLVLLLVPLLGGALMGQGMMGPGLMGWHMGWPGSEAAPGGSSGWGMALGMLMMLAFWGAVIIGIALLIRWVISPSGTEHPRPASGESAGEILKRRYAAGEITADEYAHMRATVEA